MHSRSRSFAFVVLSALSVLVGSVLAPTTASAADFRIWLSPASGPAGTEVTIYGVHDPADSRTVVWRCDAATPNQVIATIPVVNESWELSSTVPADCVAGLAEDGVPVAEVLVYGGDGALALFRLTDTPPNCPPVLFVGAHGMGEGAIGGGSGAIDPALLEPYWGATMQSAWNEFVKEEPDAWAVAGDYPRTDFIALEVASLQAAAQAAADALEVQVLDQYSRCGNRTEIVLSGYSLGAWAVDMTLRSLTGSPGGRAALGVIAGAGVLGDPAYPPHFCDVTPCRQGVATWNGRGYNTEEIYHNNGLPRDGFISLCLSYSEEDRDIICGTRDAQIDFTLGLDRGLAVHKDYIDSGGTRVVAEFLNGRLS